MKNAQSLVTLRGRSGSRGCVEEQTLSARVWFRRKDVVNFEGGREMREKGGGEL